MVLARFSGRSIGGGCMAWREHGRLGSPLGLGWQACRGFGVRCLVWEESDNEWYGVEEIQWILRDAYLISGAAVTVTVTVT